MRSVYIITLLSVGLIIFISGSAAAATRTCIITPYDGKSLNVRDKPNGKVINALRFWRLVDVVRVRNDSKGRPWGYATGKYKGKKRNWGWVFMEEVSCSKRQRKKNTKQCGWWVFLEKTNVNGAGDVVLNRSEASKLADKYNGTVHKGTSWVNSEWALFNDSGFVVTVGPYNTKAQAERVAYTVPTATISNPCNDIYLVIEKG
ncbi:MAG: hypothetical protein RDA78_25735 [Roseibium sp.]|uniref:hypothetical protein n=1 Tax=Roseibium sp. TaxID=1936156 RepID=UPI003D9C5A56